MQPNNKRSTEGGRIQQLSIRIPATLWERLGHLGISLKKSKAALIVEALERFLSDSAK